MVSGQWFWAAILFTVACVSDLLDGRLARSKGMTSVWGEKFDHGVDAIYVLGGLSGGWYLGLVPLPLLPLIGLAAIEYLWHGAVRSENVLATRLGRWNGIAYFVYLGFVIGFQLPITDFMPLREPILLWVGSVLSVSTLVSMWMRFRARLSTKKLA